MGTFSDYYHKFEKMEEFIFSDLKNATVKGHSNFLVAMALFNYIEMLGSFSFPCDEKDIEAKRFNYVFTDLLSQDYKRVFENIRDSISKPYAILRCGMTHGYLPVTLVTKNQNAEVSYSIIGADDESKYLQCINNENCGIKLSNLGGNKYKIEILNPRFIHDFKTAFETFKSKVNNEDEVKAKFILRASDLNLERLQ